jgi:hypothetical protein
MKTVKYFTNTLIAAIGIMMTGCAFTVHDVQIDPQYNAPLPRTLSEVSQKSISMERFEDRRPNAVSERMIFQQTNLNGDRTSGGWQAQKPVSEIIRDSISDGLQKAQLEIVESSGDLELSGELVDLDYRIITGMWKGQLNSQMTVKLQLKRKSDGDILWRETYFSKDSTDKFEIEEIFQRLLSDLVTQIINDDFFRQTLQQSS